MKKTVWSEESFDDFDVLGGNNFLVSAVLKLKKQRQDLEQELFGLKERLHMLEAQNSAFLNLSAERLLEKQV